MLLLQLPGGYLWLPSIISITRYCRTLCCFYGVLLPQLPGGYLALPALPGIAGLSYGVLLPQLPAGYLWLPSVSSITMYCTLHNYEYWSPLLPQLPDGYCDSHRVLVAIVNTVTGA